MLSAGAQALVVGAALSATAAAAHLACILIGAPAYRFMGAGERMARAAEAGRLRPTLVTMTIAMILLLWSAYALAGAGLIDALPLIRFVLVLASAIYLGRAIAFPLLKPAFPENSNTFWWVSSGICGLIGLAYAYGTLSLWQTL
ncbi:MAG TPA: hypothetical protein VJ652_20835 [Noviherbaspirillum sp.]|nr:hypothetical protein [Noviherbaspirillum sp.]